MSGATLPIPQHASMAWSSVKAQGQQTTNIHGITNQKIWIGGLNLVSSHQI